VISIQADFTGWQEGFKRNKDAATMVRVSLTDIGAGVVTTTDARTAANLRRAGGDVFEIPREMADHIASKLATAVKAQMHIAARTETNRRKQIRKILRTAGKDLAAAIIKRIIRGNVREKSAAYLKRQVESQERGGYITTKYGSPPPWGVASGRCVEEIKGGWRKAGSRD